MNPIQLHFNISVRFWSIGLFLSPAFMHGAPGDWDASFGVILRDSASNFEEIIGTDVVVHPDDKILVSIRPGPGSLANGMLARYLANGLPDEDFGVQGTVDMGFTWPNRIVLSGNKIVAGGVAPLGGIDFGFGVVRVESSGAFDATFDADGRVFTPFYFEGFGGSAISNAEIYALGVQSNGMVLAAGLDANTSKAALARYQTNGALDPSFGNEGKTILDYPNTYIRALSAQSDGSILVAGDGSGSGWDFLLARLLPNGEPDLSFDDDGRVLIPVGALNDSVFALAVQSDGKILLAGSSSNGSNHDFAVVRLHPSGTLDSSFGSGGKVLVAFGATTNDFAKSIAILPDGSILLGGHSNNTVAPYNGGFALCLLRTNGTLDPKFSDDGKNTHVIDSSSNYAELGGMSLQSDGKIVLVGTSSNGGLAGKVALTRFDGPPQPTQGDFDSDGLNDFAEIALAEFGFDWQDSQSELVAAYLAGSNAAGLFTANQIQALNVGVPLISKNPVTGKFKITIDWKKSVGLTTFQDFPASPGEVTIDGAGDIVFEFTSEDDAAFFRIEAE